MPGNRFPLNDGDGSDDVYIVQEDGALCVSCRFQTKCHKYAGMIEAMQSIEAYAFKEWTVDVDLLAMVTYCPTYSPSPIIDQTDEIDQ